MSIQSWNNRRLDPSGLDVYYFSFVWTLVWPAVYVAQRPLGSNGRFGIDRALTIQKIIRLRKWGVTFVARGAGTVSENEPMIIKRSMVISRSLVISIMSFYEKTRDWRIRNNRSIELNSYRIGTCPLGCSAHSNAYRIRNYLIVAELNACRVW